MVSTTSVERPASMSWAPSEAKPTGPKSLGRGEGLCPPPETEGYIRYYIQTKSDSASVVLLEVGLFHPDGLSPQLLGAEQQGKMRTVWCYASTIAFRPRGAGCVSVD